MPISDPQTTVSDEQLLQIVHNLPISYSLAVFVLLVFGCFVASYTIHLFPRRPRRILRLIGLISNSGSLLSLIAAALTIASVVTNIDALDRRLELYNAFANLAEKHLLTDGPTLCNGSQPHPEECNSVEILRRQIENPSTVLNTKPLQALDIPPDTSDALKAKLRNANSNIDRFNVRLDDEKAAQIREDMALRVRAVKWAFYLGWAAAFFMGMGIVRRWVDWRREQN